MVMNDSSRQSSSNGDSRAAQQHWFATHVPISTCLKRPPRSFFLLHFDHLDLMPPKQSLPYCEGSTSFDPDNVFDRWSKGEVGVPKENNDFYTAISETFNLRQPDKYVYYATAEVTLRQVQQGIEHGGQHGLHAWYRDEEAKPVSWTMLKLLRSLIISSPAPSTIVR